MRYTFFVPVNLADGPFRLALASMGGVPPERVVVIDNTAGGLSPRDAPGREMIRPPVPLSFTQVQNWMQSLSLARGDDAILWMHDDATFGPGVAARFLGEVGAIAASDPLWGLILTNYDAVCAYSALASRLVGPWDTALWQYESDNDWYYRLRIEHLAVHDVGASVGDIDHVVSNTRKADPHYLVRSDAVGPGVREYYQAKWGGGPHAERHRIAFGGVPHREWVRRARESDAYRSLAGIDHTGEGNLLEATDDATAAVQVETISKFLRVAGATRIMETGTNKGMFAYILSRLLPRCTLFTFDADPRSAEAARVAAAVLPNVDVRFTLGDSAATLADFREPVDLAWIDGGHDFDTCLADVRNAMRLGTPWILVDDGKLHPVTPATWAAMRADPRYVEHPNGLWDADPRGIRILRKVSGAEHVHP